MVTYTFDHHTQQISVQLRREGYHTVLAGSRMRTAAPNDVVQLVADRVIEATNRGLPGLEEWVDNQVGYNCPSRLSSIGGRRVPAATGCP
jgi:hypothetical protein